MNVLSFTRKTLIENWREPWLLGLFLAFPAMMLVIYFVAFGPSTQSMAKFMTVMVLNQDAGQQGAALVEQLRSETYDGKPLYTILPVNSEASARNVLMENKASALLVIPAGFSAELEKGAVPEVLLTGDPSADSYVFGKSFLSGSLQMFADRLAGWETPLDVRYDFVEGTGTMSDFQFGVPGLIVFGVVFGIITAAMVLVREDVNGTLQRIRLSRAGAGDLLAGIVLAVTVESAVQIPLTFGLAVLCGFKTLGSLALAMGIALALSLAACGLGFVTACFARSDGEAANLGSVFMMPLVFLSGAMFPLPDAPLGTFFGRVVSWYDLMPTTHAAEALRRILIFGDGVGELGYEVVGTVVLSVVYLGAGVWMYRWLRLRRGTVRRLKEKNGHG